jgi:hypothetical protein
MARRAGWVLLGLVGCAPSATYLDCVGPMTGSWTADGPAPLEGDLLDDGTLSMTFYDVDGAVFAQGSAQVNQTNGLSGVAGEMDLSGLLDPETCEIQGSWLTPDGSAGDWGLGG